MKCCCWKLRCFKTKKKFYSEGKEVKWIQFDMRERKSDDDDDVRCRQLKGLKFVFLLDYLIQLCVSLPLPLLLLLFLLLLLLLPYEVLMFRAHSLFLLFSIFSDKHFFSTNFFFRKRENFIAFWKTFVQCSLLLLPPRKGGEEGDRCEGWFTTPD